VSLHIKELTKIKKYIILGCVGNRKVFLNKNIFKKYLKGVFLLFSENFISYKLTEHLELSK
tara:strand:+ start:121 stop:303 length:183 start_codon:yes stop_codon:yes gene_type:complete